MINYEIKNDTTIYCEDVTLTIEGVEFISEKLEITVEKKYYYDFMISRVIYGTFHIPEDIDIPLESEYDRPKRTQIDTSNIENISELKLIDVFITKVNNREIEFISRDIVCEVE